MSGLRLLGFLAVIAAAGIAQSGTASAQGPRFRADWLSLQRDSDARPQSLLRGPDSFTASDSFNYESGWRLFFGFGVNRLSWSFSTPDSTVGMMSRQLSCRILCRSISNS